MYLWVRHVLEIFRVPKIGSWSGRHTLMAPFWKTLEGKKYSQSDLKCYKILGIEFVALDRALSKTDDTF